MSKKSNTKNIIITNLPAAAALILMAAALKLTLQFSFFISLIVLVVVYFLLGVTIELIMEKAQAKKKRENLFKQFSEGGRSNLPTSRSELYGEIESEEPVFEETEEEDEPSASVEIDELDMERKPLEETSDDYDFRAEPEGHFEDDFEDSDDIIDEEVIEDEDDFLNITINDIVKEELNAKTETEAEVESDDSSDDIFAEVFLSADAEEESFEADAEPEPEDELVAEEFTIDDIPVETSEVEEAPALEVVEEIYQEEATVEEEISVPEEVSEIQDEEVPEVQPLNEELYDALKEVGAVPEEPVDETPSEEKDARRSLFDGSDFDADTDAGWKPSLIFGSVPDTEDDLEYIPPVADGGSAPKKGKVQVDSKKIDELYAFKKAGAGESFFGKRKK